MRQADRTGVDMVWNGVSYGHLGIDLTGASGGLVRLDDIDHRRRDQLFYPRHDVARRRARLRRKGRRVYRRQCGVRGGRCRGERADGFGVPKGTYKSGPRRDHRKQGKVRGHGHAVRTSKRFILQKGYNLRELSQRVRRRDDMAFKKAFQALAQLCGPRVAGSMRAPHFAVRASSTCRPRTPRAPVLRPGVSFETGSSRRKARPVGHTSTTTSQGTYSTSNPTRLSNVVNVANVQVGSLVTGTGVGRDVYVSGINIGAKIVYISAPLYDAAGTQNFTFKRFKYLLDFSGFQSLSQFVLDDIEFQGNGFASGVMLASDVALHSTSGIAFLPNPKDRGLTSIGTGCQGMMVDRCQFNSNETALRRAGAARQLQ